MTAQLARRLLCLLALVLTVAAYAGMGIPLALAVGLLCIAALL